MAVQAQANPRTVSLGPEPTGGQELARPLEVCRQCHLEVGCLTRNGTDGDPASLEEGSLICPCLVPGRWIFAERPAKEAQSHALRCLCQGKFGAIDGASYLPVGYVLDRLDDRHHRDR